MRRAWIAFAAAVIAGCATPAPPTGAARGIVDAAEVPRLFIEAYRDGNAERIASLFAPGATFIPLLPMPRFQGPDAVRAYYQRAISNTKSRSITPSNEQVQDYGDVIVRTADIVVDQEALDGTRRAFPARVSFVYRRDRDGWRIVHHHQSVRPAAPPAAAASAPAGR